MPLYHCSKCHHEWEAVSWTICAWCGADGYVIQEKTDFDLWIEDHESRERLMKELEGIAKRRTNNG